MYFDFILGNKQIIHAYNNIIHIIYKKYVIIIIILCNSIFFILTVYSTYLSFRREQGRKREITARTLCSPLSAEFCLCHCALSGGIQHRPFQSNKAKKRKYFISSEGNRTHNLLRSQTRLCSFTKTGLTVVNKAILLRIMTNDPKLMKCITSRVFIKLFKCCNFNKL